MMKSFSLFRNLILFIVIFSITIIAASCSFKKENTSAVRIAYFPNLTHSQALMGMATGKFQEYMGEKINLEWKMFNAGPSEIEAMFAGEIDIGYIGPVPAINGYVKSKGDIQIIAGAADGGAIFVSKKDLLIKSISELSNKKIAVPQYGNTQDLSLRNLLHENGLKETSLGGTVEIVQAENPDIKALLDKGDIDAALVPEPWGSRLVKEINANVFLDWDEVWRNGNYSTAVVIARTDFIKDHPDIVEKFISAHIDITNYINENKSEAKKLINQQLDILTKKPLPSDVLDSSYEKLKITYSPQEGSVIEFADIMHNTGILKEKPDTGGLFNLGILDRVLSEKNLTR